MNWTLEQIEAGVREVRDQIEGDMLPGGLDMSETLAPSECGTAGCIGGWMLFNRFKRETGISARRKFDTGVISLHEIGRQIEVAHPDRASGLDDLFFNFPGDYAASDVVAACDKWLAGDKNPWGRALA